MFRLPTSFIAIVIFSAVALLSSCSADWHLKRAIKKNPAILQDGVVIETRVDTHYVVRPELRVDTLHRFSTDTVTSYVDRVRIRTKVDTVNRTVYVDVVCPADTVQIITECDTQVIRPMVRNGLPWWSLLIALIIGGFLIALLRR